MPPSITIESRRISAQGVASRIHNGKLPKETRKNCLMDMNTKTTGAKTGAQAFREMTEKSSTQAKETYEKMSVASTEAADLIQSSYLTAVKGVQDYNNKFFEFAHENTNAAFDFIQKMSGVRSPSAFVELSTEHARKQLESLTEQAKELATLAQKATLATAEPLKTASKPLVR
jgi:phasin